MSPRGDSGAIRVLVVDDSVVIRRLVTDALAAEPGIDVVGAAANGRIALDKITQLDPDVVTLDIEMPEMDGLATLAAIRERDGQLPVIMFSTLTERGASATLDALALGASDYVTKPGNVGKVADALAEVRAELAPRVIALGQASGTQSGARPAAAQIPPRPLERSRDPATPIRAVVVGVSTGGPNVLAQLLPGLPVLPVPLLVVQHMPPVFTRILAERLDGRCVFPVAEATGAEQAIPGHAWIAPGGRHLLARSTTEGVKLTLGDGPPENSCRPAVDVLFRSAAEVWGPGVLAVVLTGMGYDGLQGARCVTDAGGTVLVQDEASSVVWGMPGAVASAGLADAVLPPAELAAEITRRVDAAATASTAASAEGVGGVDR